MVHKGQVIQVRLLGPVDILIDQEPRQVSGLRRRALLATLALCSGQIVSTSRLISVVWPRKPPASGNTLQSHMSYLRVDLGDRALIRARPPGYVLDLGDDGTDVQTAERLLREGQQAADPVDRVRQLRAALALWRGRPLADVVGLEWLDEQAERLDLLCGKIKRSLVEARIAAGEHATLVPDLEEMTADHPLDEPVHAQLMLALYRADRQADALAAYERLRGSLAEQLGIDPSQKLRDLRTAILRQDRALDAPAPAAAQALATTAEPGSETPVWPGVVPAQLPPAVPAFAGRAAELADLDALVEGAMREGQPQSRPGRPAAMVISAVSGTAGVGKTALAVHWAHRVAAQFPDGQLYANLRGFDPGGAAEPGEAVRGFLDALGVPAARVPEGLPAQAGLYRSLLAGKRLLVVLDNARDAEQVRPLLPGAPGCLAVVTSRDRLAGLVATAGAVPLALDLLSAADARDLLTRRLGAERVAAEPGAVIDIIARCSRLPLALSIAAARAATSPGFPLAAVAAELGEADRALDSFDGADRATDMRAVFSWSCRTLSRDAARMFRLLSLHPGPGITTGAAASLTAVPPGRARTLLAELTRAHLLAEHSPGRYAFHDLLRAYAAEQAQAGDSNDERSAAVHRVLEHYVHTAQGAAAVMEPVASQISLAPPRPGVIADAPATAEDALRWFTAEHTALLAAVQLAAAQGFHVCAWQLAWTLTAFHLRRGLWADQALACHAGLCAARQIGDKTGEAHALLGLAVGLARSGRFDAADPYFQQALQHFEEVGDYARQALIEENRIWLAERQQRPADMLTHSLRALELYRAAGHRVGQATAANDIGWSHALLGSYQQAITYCQRGLAASQELGERNGQASSWDSLGFVQHRLGNHLRSVQCYQRAIDIYRDLGDLFNEADSLCSLGDVHQSQGELDAARRAWSDALRIFGEIGHPDG